MARQRHITGRSASRRDAPRSQRAFLAAYVLAQTGAFVAFVPLLQVLVPERLMHIAPARAPALLGAFIIAGAAVASVANLAAGIGSDLTPERWGRRRSWLLAGLGATLLAYAAVRGAHAWWTLLLAVLGFQLAFNMLFAPLTALLADRVPAGSRGTAAALLGLGNPIGSALGVALAGLRDASFDLRLALIGLLVIALLMPLILVLRVPAVAAPIQPPAPERLRGFGTALASRLAVTAALNLVQSYLLFFVAAAAARGMVLPGSPVVVMTRLVVAATLANVVCGLAAGLLADRLRASRAFILGGAVAIGLGTLAITVAPGYRLLLAAACLWGGGTGVFQAVDLALMARLLPPGRGARSAAGRGFGIVNLANTLPPMLLPLLGLRILHGAVPDYRPLFWAAAAAAVAGGLLILRIRPVD